MPIIASPSPSLGTKRVKLLKSNTSNELIAVVSDLYGGDQEIVMGSGGSGDMTKAVYDPDEDGKIAENELELDYPTHSNSLDHDGASQDTVISGKANLSHGHSQSEITNLPSDLSGKAAIDHNHSGVYEPSDSNIQTHVTSPHAPSNAQKNSDILKSEIEAKLTGEISSHTHAGGGGDGEITVVATQDTANNTTTLANAVGLTFPALANSTYIIEVFLVWASSATSVGIKVSATASGSPTINSGHFITDAANGTPDGSSYNADNVVVTTSASPFTSNCMGQLAAILKTSVASTWQLRFAAETTGSISIKAGSTLRYRKVA